MPIFPLSRPRRNRKSAWSRDMLRETVLQPENLILPLFIIEGSGTEPIATMPGVERLGIKETIKTAEKAMKLGIKALALFPKTDPAKKTSHGQEACNPENLICRTLREIKKEIPDIGLIADVALDPYTSHGHDGIINDKGEIDNDGTIEMLIQQSLVQAEAGCDIIAPSDMMDGRIQEIRMALEQNGYKNTQILAYSAKYASNLYGPFRDAVGSQSALKGGDKKTYQMDPANTDEALREIAMDIEEGADMVMVKPALCYLDIIRRAKDNFNIPIFAYHVSGEYSMMKLAIAQGIIKEEAMEEAVLSIKRAGATGILTYAALDLAEKIAKKHA